MRVRPLEQTLLMLRDCLCEQIDLAAAEVGSITQPVCMCAVITGDSVPLDYCGPGSCGTESCGMAWVRLVGVTANESPTGNGCAQPLEATVEMGIVRCSQTIVEEDGSLPGEEDHLRESLISWEDMAIMRRALGCCTGISTMLTEFTPLGPEGGCIGGAWQATVEIT